MKIISARRNTLRAIVLRILINATKPIPMSHIMDRTGWTSAQVYSFMAGLRRNDGLNVVCTHGKWRLFTEISLREFTKNPKNVAKRGTNPERSQKWISTNLTP